MQRLNIYYVNDKQLICPFKAVFICKLSLLNANIKNRSSKLRD